MELGQRLVTHGAKVTFVNTETTQRVITNNWLEIDKDCKELMQMVSIPDGLEPWEDRNNFDKLLPAMRKRIPSELEQLIEIINKQEDNKITCLIVDFWLAWALHVTKKMEIRRAIFFPASTATLATVMSIPRLIDDGFIDNNGIPRTSEMIRLTKAMPPIKPKNLVWACVGDSSNIKDHFHNHVEIVEAATMTEWTICNSAVELEPAAFNMFPKVLSVGPLLASNRLANQAGHFWEEDSTCIPWLDQQPACSVIYIAFGSITNINQTQFEDLALGLELANRPFLWVVRQGLTKEPTVAYPDGYMDRVGSRGKIVSWAPQQKVLAHPSVACFMSHCGWNSTLEGVTNGRPFLCWPYFADQFHNETYICDIWKTGLRMKEDEAGIITRERIKSKVEQLLSDKTFKSNAMGIKEKVESSVKKGGLSHNNLTIFLDWIHGKDADNKDHQV
ncbi:hypothetical protein M8C21_014494 [Ambrosia artemisiifolia]|uniref:UDP-glycosyltransferase 83A1-like protein n=1 Tax=Ambrosia artemisiifolia TaxID=4212 RepID=A0AAD5GV60_AMBAR|nr:hypothetical protein M8C21_014494 [Ambrosia artemisiifolia]